MHDEMQPQNPEMHNLPNGQVDHEGAMAKADLYKLANYSLKLFKQIQDGDQMESWVQAKITKAADYVASVYHYLEYEMKFSEYGAKLENSEMYSESEKIKLKNKLLEAKSAIKELKMTQAEKLASHSSKKIKEEVSKDACDAQPEDNFDEKMGETMSGGKDEPCPTCHGTGHIAKPERKVPEEVKAKVKAYNRKAKAMSAAVKRVDKNKNGIPDDLEDEEVEEDFEGLNKTGDTAKTSKGGTVTKTAKGIKHEPDASKFTDEPHTEPKSIAKSRSAAEKSGDKAADKEQTKKSKDWSKRFGKDSVTKVSAGKKVDPNAPKEKEVDETYGQGVYSEGKGKKPDFLDMDKDGDKKEPMKKAVADKKKNPFAKKVDEALKGKQKKLDQDKDGDIEADDLAALRAKKKVKEGLGGHTSMADKLARATVKTLIAMERESGDPMLGQNSDVHTIVDTLAQYAGPQGEKIAAAIERLNGDEFRQWEEQVWDMYHSLSSHVNEAKKGDDVVNKAEKMRIAKGTGTGIKGAIKDVVSGLKGEKPAHTNEALAESADLDRIKQFLTRLNG